MYEERIVVFIDILGFKDLVEKGKFEDVNSVYDEFLKMVKKMNERINSNIFFQKLAAKIETKEKLVFKEREDEIVFFSDCVVWSYPTGDLSKLPFILVLINVIGGFHILFNILFGKGILIRGGLSIGNIYQKGNKLFGDGLIKAYLMEQKAKYPRIAIDKDIVLNKGLTANHFRMLKGFVTFSIAGDYFFYDYFKIIRNSVAMNDDSPQGKEVMQMVRK